MSNESVQTTLSQHRLVPVIVLEGADDAIPLAERLIAGGLPIAEVTFRTDAAAESIRRMTTVPGLHVGAGTVLSVSQADEAIDAGATFVVAPGFNPKVVRHCIDKGVPIIPGVSNPTDIEMGIDHGLALLKFCPAEAIGGVKLLRAIAAPYRGIEFVPTGGISPDNLPRYLELASVVACGGSWMVPPTLIKAKDFGAVERLVREAVSLVSNICPASKKGGKPIG